jgi:hypothetical protein
LTGLKLAIAIDNCRCENDIPVMSALSTASTSGSEGPAFKANPATQADPRWPEELILPGTKADRP